MAKVYCIECNITGEKYIGSTTIDWLSNRIAIHNYQSKHDKVNCSSKSIMKRGDYKYYILEEFENISTKELHDKERDYIMKTDKCVNKVMLEDPKEVVRRAKRNYRLANREKLLAHNREKVVCECGAEVSRQNLKRHQEGKSHIKNMQEK